MNGKIPCIILLIICCMLVAGCTDQNKEKPVATPAPSVIPAQTPVLSSSPTIPPTSGQTTIPTIFDQPVTKPPANLTVAVSVRKDPVYSTITTTFDGGKGQDLVQSIQVRTTLSTGIILTNELGKEKGDELILNGTRGADRVQVAVTFMNGNSYQITDTMMDPNRSEPVTGTGTPVADKTMSINEDGLYPGPVTIPPNNLVVSVDVQKEPIYRVITGTFRGGHGQFLVSRIDMNAVLGSGEPVTRQIANNIGATAEMQGTDGVDRIQIVVTYKNGETYKIYEKAFGPRGESFT